MEFIPNLSKLCLLSTGPYNGRDKSTKVLSYLCRLVAHQWLLVSPESEKALRLFRLWKKLSISRKGMRLFKCVDEAKNFQTLLLTMKSGMLSLEKVFSVISSVCMFFRWSFDHLSFLERIGVLPRVYEFGKTSSTWLFVSSISHVLRCCKILLSKPGPDIRYETRLNLVGKMSDLVNAAHGSTLLRTGETLQAVCGLTSSSLSLRKVWLAVTKDKPKEQSEPHIMSVNLPKIQTI
jgi:hypothetical protein